MITVKVWEHGVELSGHANSATAGEDLICAAASGIWYAFSSAMNNDREHGWVKYTECEQPGYTRLTIQYASPGKEERIQAHLDMLKCGFRLLAENYPKNVRIKKAAGVD